MHGLGAPVQHEQADLRLGTGHQLDLAVASAEAQLPGGPAQHRVGWNALQLRRGHHASAAALLQQEQRSTHVVEGRPEPGEQGRDLRAEIAGRQEQDWLVELGLAALLREPRREPSRAVEQAALMQAQLAQRCLFALHGRKAKVRVGDD